MLLNIKLYPWFKFIQSLSFWQATWFLYFEGILSAADAILLYVVYDIATTVFEVPSGYMSDRLGRKRTLFAAAITAIGAALIFVTSSTFAAFACGNILLGASMAFASGTDSALLYESLDAEGRADEIEKAELRAWRFSFSGLALSAFTGGAMALFDTLWPYVGGVVAACVLLAITSRLQEPPHSPQSTHRENWATLRASLRHPTLLWLLGLTLVMYVFSHIPFIFGQPFIREAMTQAGYGAQTTLVSGSVTATMMLVSILVSLVALPLRNRIGLTGILLLAFAMQIGLTAALATSNGLFVIGLLFLRMVPDSLSQPFVRARIQPLLRDGTRATYMSVQSLAGRILFAIALTIASGQAADDGPLPYADIQNILSIYAFIGVACLIVLTFTARRAKVEPSGDAAP